MTLMRQSMQKERWFKTNLDALNNGILKAVPYGNKQILTGWHITRRYEYPWILQVAPPRGDILDIGHNAQFVAALLGMGVKRIVAHSTHHDTSSLGKIAPWISGGICLHDCWSGYKNELQLVLGTLDRLDFIRDQSFDTIYCLSVIEHLPPAEVGPLIDGMWRLLRPGGRIAFTCDWFVDFEIDDGIQGKVLNHDLFPYLVRNKMIPRAACLPFPIKLKQEMWFDGDTVIVDWEGSRLGVYGFTVKKPK